MKRSFWAAWVACTALFCSCSLDGDDDPTQIKDLRVLAMSTEAPELMASSCDTTSPLALLEFAQLVKVSALIFDPAGAGRPISWELLACASADDRTCSDANSRIIVTSGQTSFGELSYTFSPGLLTLPNQPDRALLQEVLAQDKLGGLGGLRMPLVLHLRAGEEDVEEVFAQKLMVFSCALFPDSQANVTPVLPGLRLFEQPWTGVATVNHSDGKVSVQPEDFIPLEENYVVPGLDLKPIQLTESWKVGWSTTVGRMNRSETGGTDFNGTTGHQIVEWVPPDGLTDPTPVTVWAVVRDGRGGTSWLSRQFMYRPDQ